MQAKLIGWMLAVLLVALNWSCVKLGQREVTTVEPEIAWGHIGTNTLTASVLDLNANGVSGVVVQARVLGKDIDMVTHTGPNGFYSLEQADYSVLLMSCEPPVGWVVRTPRQWTMLPQCGGGYFWLRRESDPVPEKNARVKQMMVHGRVLDEQAKPVSGAIVLGHGSAARPWDETNANGAFTLFVEYMGEKPQEGIGITAIHHAKRLGGWCGVRLDSSKLDAVEIQMVGWTNVTGTVFDPTGRPLPGATVFRNDHCLAAWLVPVGTTDKQGTFNLDDMIVGSTYSFGAVHPKYGMREENRVYWDSTSPPPSIKLLPRNLSVSGKAVDDEGNLLGGVVLGAERSLGDRVCTVTDTKGQFRFDGIVAGPVSIHGEKEIAVGERKVALYGQAETEAGQRNVKVEFVQRGCGW